MIALITAALTVLAMVLEIVAQNRKTPEQRRNDEIQQGRKDIANGDAVAVSNRIDGLLPVSESSGVVGQPSSEDIERRISNL